MIFANTYSGLWQRLVLSQPGAPVDALTRVDWLQGPEFYVDLRQPAGLAGKVRARCLNDLTREEALALATQEGFAGRFVLTGNEAEWQRGIDFRPCPLGDRGRLEPHGELLIEHGIEADYIEYWQREPQTGPGHGGCARYTADDGSKVILVRQGHRFGYARDRHVPLGRHDSLAERLSAATLDEARALSDCEISLGTISAQGWRIERSSLPWKEDTLLLGPEAHIAGDRLIVADVNAAGAPMLRGLHLIEAHGTFDGPAMPVSAATAAAPEQFVPVIDMAALGSGDAHAEAATVAALRRAAGEVGFLHITGHGIAPEVIARMQAAAKAFFALPLERKLACYIGQSGNHRGYVPEGEETLGEGKRDLKEAFDLALDLPADAVPQDHPMLGANQWPDLPGFREDVMAYYAAAFAVGRRLLRGFTLAAGQAAGTLDRQVVTPPSQLRLIHYPYQADAADTPGIGAHTDYECFTLLLTTGPGLEVMNQAGAWIDAPPVPGALVVNIGDMLEFWSGGAFVATSHRVRKVAEERYSFPLFFALDYDVELRALGQTGGEAIRTGEHLFAQTAQTFRYLRQRIARGELTLPDAARPVSSFGQEARHRLSESSHFSESSL